MALVVPGKVAIRYEEMFKLFDHDKDGLLNRRDLMKAGACAEGTAMQVTPPDGIGSARQRAGTLIVH